jgi:sec-independent protein translocase protein TatB
VVFGPQKLPELARGLGKLMAEFRKASVDFKTAFEEEMRDLERQALQAERKKDAEAVTASSIPVAEPAQPVASAASEGTETAAGETLPETQLATDAPVVAPVVESVARGSEDPAESRTDGAAPAKLQDSPQDAQRLA